jgi:ubiquinone/menaquinone biosynthesis C-methylase UbiE
MTASAPRDDFDRRAATWDDDPMKTARARAVADAIQTHLPDLASMRGFEYGCGTGLLSFALQSSLREIVLADNSDGMLDVLRCKIDSAQINNMTPIRLDLSTDPLPGQQFDLACSLMTLHHIPDTDDILRKLHALLADSGHLCIADLDREDGSFHGAGFDGHNGFDRADLARRAEHAGFINVAFSTVFTINRGQPEKSYPVFLMYAQKRAEKP